MNCAPCNHAETHAWWGPSLAPYRSHCRRCHRSWSSLKEGHCVSCCAHFANGEIGDYHRRGEVCAPPAEVLKRNGTPRYAVRETPQGPVFRLVSDGPRPDFGSFGRAGDDIDSDEHDSGERDSVVEAAA